MRNSNRKTRELVPRFLIKPRFTSDVDESANIRQNVEEFFQQENITVEQKTKITAKMYVYRVILDTEEKISKVKENKDIKDCWAALPTATLD